MLLPRSLSARLTLTLTVMVALVAGASGYYSIRTQERQLIGELVTGADQLSRSLTSATWHSMLANRREDAYAIMRTIGERQGIERIRMINKEGRVTYSTDEDDVTEIDIGSKACTVCHASAEPSVEAPVTQRVRFQTERGGYRSMGIVAAIYNEPSCSSATGTTVCHPPAPERTMLGVLDVTLDLRHVDDEVASLKLRRGAMTAVEIILIALVIAFFSARFVRRPIGRLMVGVQAVSAMRLDQPIEVHDETELGELARAFNDMRERLREALGRIESFTQDLERKVEERSRQLEFARRKLIQSDRMASLGQLAASVAHEINNPVSGVLNLATIMQRLLRDGHIPEGREAEFRRYLDQVAEQTAHVGRIVSDLLTFSRRSTPRSGRADLNRIIEETLALLRHKLELGRVEITRELATDLPSLECDAPQMQQVLINLVMNAAEAQSGGGRITVRTRHEPEADVVVAEVEDGGPGIPDHVLPRIFDPFFTTKDEGKGVGLGLSVVYGIVDAHGGSVDVVTGRGRGTTFSVRLPLERQRRDGRTNGTEGPKGRKE